MVPSYILVEALVYTSALLVWFHASTWLRQTGTKSSHRVDLSEQIAYPKRQMKGEIDVWLSKHRNTNNMSGSPTK